MPIRRNAAAKPSKRDTQIASIARRHLGFETLERRYSDELDFRDVLVSSAEAALNEAYDLGQASGITAGLRAAARDAKPKANPRRRNSSAEDYDRFLDAKHKRRLASEARLETRLERREAEAAALIGELQRGPKTVYYINILGKNGRPTGRIKEGTYAELVNYLLRNKYV